jgi:hypothetical protein
MVFIEETPDGFVLNAGQSPTPMFGNIDYGPFDTRAQAEQAAPVYQRALDRHNAERERNGGTTTHTHEERLY